MEETYSKRSWSPVLSFVSKLIHLDFVQSSEQSFITDNSARLDWKSKIKSFEWLNRTWFMGDAIEVSVGIFGTSF